MQHREPLWVGRRSGSCCSITVEQPSSIHALAAHATVVGLQFSHSHKSIFVCTCHAAYQHDGDNRQGGWTLAAVQT